MEVEQQNRLEIPENFHSNRWLVSIMEKYGGKDNQEGCSKQGTTGEGTWGQQDPWAPKNTTEGATEDGEQHH